MSCGEKMKKNKRSGESTTTAIDSLPDSVLTCLLSKRRRSQWLDLRSLHSDEAYHPDFDSFTLKYYKGFHATPSSSSSQMAKSQVILPEDLVIEVLSFLPGKSLMRMKCVCKSWETLIADPIFIKMHVNKLSTQNTHFALLEEDKKSSVSSVISIPAGCLLDDTLIICSAHRSDPDFHFDSNNKILHWIVGSCNGLICLLGSSFFFNHQEHSLCFWNPATRTKSEQKLGFFRCYQNPRNILYKFSFGYDNSTDTYKVVLLISKRNEDGTGLIRPAVRVFTLGDNVWRDIDDCFPVTTVFYRHSKVDNNGVYLSNSINWLVCHHHYKCHLKNLTVKEFVIVSLDLGTETYSQLLLPQCCNEEPLDRPILSVLMDCLCISYDFKKTYFVIWQMKEFGVQESWTQFLKIRYDLNLSMGYVLQLIPLCLVENGDTLILATNFGTEAIVYDWRNNRERTTHSINSIPWHNAKGYVQSLVSPC